MTSEVILALLRHALTAVAGCLVAKGYLSADDASVGVGLVAGAVGLALSIQQKRRQRVAVAVALATPPPSRVIPMNRNVN